MRHSNLIRILIAATKTVRPEPRVDLIHEHEVSAFASTAALLDSSTNLANQGFLYKGTGTIKVLRESPNAGLKTYTFVYEKVVLVVVTQDRVIHLPGKPTITGGEDFP